MTDLDLETLDKLFENTTQSLWTAESSDLARYPSQEETVIFANTDCELHPIADFSCNLSCRVTVESEANAKFVAAVVNAWPDIRKRLS